ncbi:MAG: TetR/AcrR family transcriptional regulator [Rhodocyclaceae bacterium]|nr:MAG: TetR/AcrR family transcriptional regulator [Rhodocyclaceae bacterium]
MFESRRCTIPDITGQEGTRERLMMAGEALMGRRGLGEVPLEEIAVRAQQRNKYAVQYHFESREGLAQAIMDVRFRQIEMRRGELRRAIDPDDLDAIFAAFLFPLAEQTDRTGNRSFARFLLQFIARDEPLKQIMHPVTAAQDTSPTVALFTLACAASGIDPGALYQRIQLFLPVPLRFLADQPGGLDQPVIPEGFPALIRMLTAALSVRV